MATQTASIERYVRPLAEVREIMLERARENRNPFDFTNYGEVQRIFDQLTSLEREEWAAAFSAAARPYEECAQAAEAAGDLDTAKALYLQAYGYDRVARYPAPNSPAKREAYRRSQWNYLKAARYFDPPLDWVEMPFRGRPGEGEAVVGYLRRPGQGEPAPVVVMMGGIDSFKEERRVEPYLERGLATLAIDMPGVGDAPIAGSEDAERMFDAVFDWIATRPNLDAGRIGVYGGSTGGYWAAKLAHTHRGRVRAAVNHGGCAHYAFTAEWIAKAQRGEYPFELAETLACAFGRSTCEEWVEYAPRHDRELARHPAVRGIVSCAHEAHNGRRRDQHPG